MQSRRGARRRNCLLLLPLTALKRERCTTHRRRLLLLLLLLQLLAHAAGVIAETALLQNVPILLLHMPRAPRAAQMSMCQACAHARQGSEASLKLLPSPSPLPSVSRGFHSLRPKSILAMRRKRREGEEPRDGACMCVCVGGAVDWREGG